MRPRLLTYLLLAVLTVTGPQLTAQRLPRTPVTFLDTEHGLSNNTVRCIWKDHNGFMWFGTRDGLNRYDGNEFTVFRHQFKDSNSLICNFILSLCEDNAHKLWVGTRQGLNTYDNLTGQWSVISWLSADDHAIRPLTGLIKALETDGQGNMLIGVEGLGLLIRRKDAKTAIQIPLNGSASDKLNGSINHSNSDKGTPRISGGNGAPASNGSPIFHYSVQAIKRGEDNTIWVLVENKGLCLLDETTGQLKLVNNQLPQAYSMEYADKSLWIGNGNGLYRYDPILAGCIKAWELPPGGNSIRAGDKAGGRNHSARRAGEHNTGEGNYAIGHIEERNYAAGRTEERTAEQNTGRYNTEGHNTDEIRALRKDKKGHLLISTLQGRLLTWDMGQGHLPRGLESEAPHVPNNETPLVPSNEAPYILNSGTIYDLYVDESAHEWIGTAKGGIGVIDPQRSRFHTFSNLPGTSGFPANFITSFYETPDSNLFIGTDGDGMLFYNRKAERFTTYRHNPSDRNTLSANLVMDMCGDYLGNIWLATQDNGIDVLDPATHHFGHYHCTRSATDAEKNMVWAVYEDKRKNLWASTLRKGSLMGALYRFDRAADRFTAFDTSLSDLFTFYEDKEGTLWSGNLSQLVEIDRTGRHHHFYTVNSAVRTVCEDGNGHLWIGTEGGGLLLFDRQRHKIVMRYTTDEGLCNNTVFNILEDRAGDLWISTGNGLSRFTPATGQFRNYFQADGLQSNEFFFNAALPLHSGEMAFGGVKGFNLFDPLSIRETTDMPRLLLTGVAVNGIPVEKDPSVVSRWGAAQVEEIQIPFNKASFSFDFTALEYSAPKEIAYSYFMDGWDRKWTDAGHQRRAAYTHLDEGRYTFRIKSTNAEGKWNPIETTLHIIVFPPWYRTWWAYTLYALLAGFLFAVYWGYKERQTKLKYQITIAGINAERQRSEHEKKLSFFTNISHEFRTPLTLIINPVKDLLKQSAAKDPAIHPDAGFEQAELNVIHRNARRMLSLVDQLLLFRKADSGADRLLPVKLNLYHLCREVYFSFTQQARVRNIDYVFECDKENLEVYADREKVEIILFNLVSNALKYTPDNGAVTLRVREENLRILVEVADSGPGIPPEAGDRIFEHFYQASDAVISPKSGFGIGLFLARQFALAHKGQLTYQSQPGKGTIFTLELLKGNTHLDGTQLGEDGTHPSEIFKELVEETVIEEDDPNVSGAGFSGSGISEPSPGILEGWVDEKKVMLVIDDDPSMRRYVTSIFRDTMTIHEAANGEEGTRLALEHIPDIIISDIKMQGVSGIELCRAVKSNPATAHIPVILLTGTLSSELQLEGVEGGADDYITKPFDKELLQARAANLLQSRNNLRRSLFNEVTHNETSRKISASDKEFLDKCTALIENHLDEEEFTVKTMAMEMGISHSSLYKRIKTLSGHSLNGFIRMVRLKNAAILCINSTYNVNEIASRVGIVDRTHFRQQFQKIYGMTAAEYIRRYRKPFTAGYNLKK